jgi:hypothetical protein
MVMKKGDKVGTLYLCIVNVYSYISLSSTEVDTILWHQRLKHISEKGIQILHKRNLLLDLKKVDRDFCENYAYGKHKRVIFLRVKKEKKSERIQMFGE